MKRKIFILLTFALSFLFDACGAFSSKVTLEDKIAITKNTLETLNGTYEISPFVVKSKSSNWYLKDYDTKFQSHLDFYGNIKTNNKKDSIYNAITKDYNNYLLKIEINSDKKLQLNLIKQNETVDSFNLKYTIKNGYVYIKNKNLRIFGLPYLLGEIDIYRVRMCLNKKGDIILQHCSFSGAGILIILCDFKKIDNSSVYHRQAN